LAVERPFLHKAVCNAENICIVALTGHMVLPAKEDLISNTLAYRPSFV
jgi:hypothetical protein